MTDINKEMEEMAEKLEKSAKPEGYDSLKETIIELGAEGLKKAMPNLSEDQKTLLKSVVEDLDKSSYDLEPEIYSTVNGDYHKILMKPEYDESDEELVDEADEKDQEVHRNQGGVPVEGWEGQIIKAEKMKKEEDMEEGKKDSKKEKVEEAAEEAAEEEVEEHEEEMHSEKMEKKKMKKSFQALVERMIERKLEKSKCVSVLAKNMETTEDKIGAIWDALEKAMSYKYDDGSVGESTPEKDQVKTPSSEDEPKEGGVAEPGPDSSVQPYEDKAAENQDDKDDAKHATKETADEAVAQAEGKVKKSEETEQDLEKGKSVKKYVDMILSDKLQVQDVLKEAPDEMKDDILAALRERDKGVENKEEKKEEIKKSDEFSLEEAKDPFKVRKIGQNCHYDVDSYLANEYVQSFKKSTFDYDSENLEKGETRESINDLLESKKDLAKSDYYQKINEMHTKASGAFLIKSFDDSDMDGLFAEQDMYKAMHKTCLKDMKKMYEKGMSKADLYKKMKKAGYSYPMEEMDKAYEMMD